MNRIEMEIARRFWAAQGDDGFVEGAELRGDQLAILWRHPRGLYAGTKYERDHEGMELVPFGRLFGVLNRLEHPLCVEVSAWRYDDNGTSIVQIDDAQCAADGYGVYIRNPLAMHVQDFTGQDFGLWLEEKKTEARLQAFAWADALAEHLGCEVISQLER